MFGSAWFGVSLNSGGTTHAMKLLEEEEYARFVDEFERVPSAVTESRRLHEQMKLKGRVLQIAVAWRHYAGARLREKGFGDTWQRKYLELPEFFGYVGNFSESFNLQCTARAALAAIFRFSVVYIPPVHFSFLNGRSLDTTIPSFVHQ
jgi:hypothetical protein